MQLFMDTQVQLEKLKQAKRSGSDDMYSQLFEDKMAITVRKRNVVPSAVSIYRVPVMLGRGVIQWIYMINIKLHTLVSWWILLLSSGLFCCVRGLQLSYFHDQEDKGDGMNIYIYIPTSILTFPVTLTVF